MRLPALTWLRNPVASRKYTHREAAMTRRQSLKSSVGVFFAAAFLSGSSVVSGQGVTTAALTGNVNDTSGVPIGAATVIAIHLPTNTQYRASLTSSGRYNLPNLKIGGPYRVTATSIAYEPPPAPALFLSPHPPAP